MYILVLKMTKIYQEVFIHNHHLRLLRPHHQLPVLHHHLHLRQLQVRCWGVCVKDDKHDAGVNHLINNCTMYSFITFGLPDKIYWQAPKNPTSTERTNVIHYTGPAKWVRTPNGEVLNPCQKSAMIEKLDRETHQNFTRFSCAVTVQWYWYNSYFGHENGKIQCKRRLS